MVVCASFYALRIAPLKTKSSIWQVPAGFGSESKFSKKLKYAHKSTFLTKALKYLFAFMYIVKMLFKSTKTAKLEPYL